MVVDRAVVNVTLYDPSNSSVATNSWGALPPGGLGVVPLTGYWEGPTSVNYYCYDANSRISEQFESSFPGSLPEAGFLGALATTRSWGPWSLGGLILRSTEPRPGA